ncbi:MAG: hypothetical protein LAO79_12435 [Acidobacteriia bacterium]|nr:hypothetical protein [Terriglobia bacterium]
MLLHGFDMYRVYLSTPGDLAREQDVCRAAIAEVNDQTAMPRKILLVAVGLREEGQIVGHRSAVAENVRMCSYFIQVFADDWGPGALHRKIFDLALECRDDAELPMREVIVCLKSAPRERDPAVLALRQELENSPNVRVISFEKAADLKTQLLEVCGQWVRDIMAAGGGVAAGAAS